MRHRSDSTNQTRPWFGSGPTATNTMGTASGTVLDALPRALRSGGDGTCSPIPQDTGCASMVPTSNDAEPQRAAPELDRQCGRGTLWVDGRDRERARVTAGLLPGTDGQLPANVERIRAAATDRPVQVIEMGPWSYG